MIDGERWRVWKPTPLWEYPQNPRALLVRRPRRHFQDALKEARADATHWKSRSCRITFSNGAFPFPSRPPSSSMLSSSYCSRLCPDATMREIIASWIMTYRNSKCCEKRRLGTSATAWGRNRMREVHTSSFQSRTTSQECWPLLKGTTVQNVLCKSRKGHLASGGGSICRWTRWILLSICLSSSCLLRQSTFVPMKIVHNFRVTQSPFNWQEIVDLLALSLRHALNQFTICRHKTLSCKCYRKG